MVFHPHDGAPPFSRCLHLLSLLSKLRLAPCTCSTCNALDRVEPGFFLLRTVILMWFCHLWGIAIFQKNVIQLRQELSCALCKGNARMYGRSLLTLARGVRRGFMPGLERAIDEAGDVFFRPFLLFLPLVLGSSPSI